jgi:hypothetical protein
MYKKVLTMECPSCKCLKIDDENQFRCEWGKSKKGKILLPHKGRKPHTCNLGGRR